MKPGPSLNHEEDLQTRILNEHWIYRYVETQEELQKKIDKILRRKR